MARFSESTRYTLYGALFGLCFPVGSVAFLHFIGELRSFDSLRALIVQAHAHSSLLYVIDTAPFFLGLFARLAGVRQDRILRFSASLEQEVANKTESLQRALEEARKANETIAHMAEHDALTGLLNRRRFQQELDRWTDYALRYQHSAALLFIDLDRFKYVNDTYGHLAGDEHLVAVAQALKRVLRSTDYLARWGGDEFAILLPETESAPAMDVANKLLRALHETAYTTAAGQTLPMEASIGIALLPAHTSDANQLVVFADAAMYEAKNAGGNCWRLYSATPQEVQRVQEQVQWEARIRRALETDQFILVYQPLLHMGAGETRDYEALLRMEDPSGQLLSPGMFLESAERFGLATAIDRMVIRKVAHRIAGLREDGYELRLSLNLSRRTLEDPGLIRHIEHMIAETGIAPSSLGFEIPERVALENLALVHRLAGELRQLGCQCILDDFGLSFSSFHYLRKLALDRVKIEGVLIRDLQNQPENQRFIRTLSAILHEFNVEVVAKFVEDPGQLEILRELGVDYAQGFAIGRPLESIEQIKAYNTRGASALQA